VRLFKTDARNTPLPDKSVQCVVTSPPYFQKRRYQDLPSSVWGGDPSCEHDWGESNYLQRGSDAKHGLIQGANLGSLDREEYTQAFCQRCNGWWGTLGNEPNLEMFVNNIVEVFREVNFGLTIITGTKTERNTPLPARDFKVGQWNEVGKLAYFPTLSTSPHACGASSRCNYKVVTALHKLLFPLDDFYQCLRLPRAIIMAVNWPANAFQVIISNNARPPSNPIFLINGQGI